MTWPEKAERTPYQLLFIMSIVNGKPKKLQFFLPNHILYWSNIFINRPELPEIRKKANFQVTKVEYCKGNVL